ncbi:MAG TPA: hypothetical protein DIS74_09775 [Bacteroidales bacterium]|nr:hypothetical protein [Bacteroidales bacterium]
MKLDLTKEDLVCLVIGTGPNYVAMDHALIKNLGWYNDNRGWQWIEGELNKLSEETLLSVYTLCRNSWKK